MIYGREMAKVYTGKISIPGEKVDNYLQAMKENEQATKPFKDHMGKLNQGFKQHLLKSVSVRTASKHFQIIDAFIEFLIWKTDVRGIEDISRGIANSYFRSWYKSKIGDYTDSELKTGIKKFFQFLDEEKGITNEAVLKSFKRR